MSAGILLGRHGGLSIEARSDGIYAVGTPPGIRCSNPAQWPEDRFDAPQALQAGLQFSRLLERGLAGENDEFLRIPYTHFPTLLKEGFSLPLLWSEWSPFTLSLRTHGSLSGSSLRFSPSFRLGDLEVDVERAGRYVRRTGHPDTWLLDDLTFALLERLDSPPTADGPWVDFAFVKDYAAELCAEMDDCLRRNEVIFPAAIRIGAIPGRIRSTPEPCVDEVPDDVFRRAFRASSTIARRLLMRLPGGAWGHVIFDDSQLAFLRAIRAHPLVTGYPPPISIPEAPVGRMAMRMATIDSQPKKVPVRLRSRPSPAAILPPDAGQQTVYDREVRHMRNASLEGLVACVYARRGFGIAITPEGSGLGAGVIAVRDGEVWLIRLEAGPAGLESLEALVRMRAAYRRIVDRPYRLSLVVRTECSARLRRRARVLNAELLDGARLIDEVESGSITYEEVLKAVGSRCRSNLEVAERLQQLLAGDPVGEPANPSAGLQIQIKRFFRPDEIIDAHQ